jgi:hypothetical protein
MNSEESLVNKELLDLGFHSDLQRRGLVKWINGILAVVLFISLLGNIFQWRKQVSGEIEHTKQIIEAQAKTDRLNEKYIDVFIRMLNKQEKAEQKLDTTLSLLNSAKP